MSTVTCDGLLPVAATDSIDVADSHGRELPVKNTFIHYRAPVDGERLSHILAHSASVEHTFVLFSWGGSAPPDRPRKAGLRSAQKIKIIDIMLEISYFGPAGRRLFGGAWEGGAPPGKKIIYFFVRPLERS